MTMHFTVSLTRVQLQLQETNSKLLEKSKYLNSTLAAALFYGRNPLSGRTGLVFTITINAAVCVHIIQGKSTTSPSDPTVL